MKGLWNETEAAQYRSDLKLRVYSRLLGRNPSLVPPGRGGVSAA